CNSSTADIHFILDSSGSVSNPDFAKMVKFVEEMVKGFDVGKDKVRVAVSLFAGSNADQFHLNKYYDKNALLSAISKIQRISGTTNTADALNKARTVGFTAKNGDRPKVPNIAIVITDGNSNNAQETATAATNLKNTQAVVFSIGVGSNIRQAELEAIATGPGTTHVFQVTNFAALGNIKKELATKTCEAQKVIPTQAPACNSSTADIHFILDSSGSVSNPDFAKMVKFVEEMVKGFDIGKDKVRVAVSLFADSNVDQFHLNKYYDKNALLSAISKIQRRYGNTNTADALNKARTVGFTAKNGDRPKVPNIAIVITDGNSIKPQETATAATNLKNTQAVVFSIGVGSNISQAELEAIATGPGTTHVFQVTNFAALGNIKKELATNTCEAQKVIPTQAPACNQSMADIVFLLDSSGSVGASNFQKMLQFVENMVNGFDVGKDSVRIGVASFSSTPVQHFALNKYFNKSDIISAISKLPYNQGSTNTAAAISLLRTGVFTASSGDRPTAPNIAIIITDGQSDDPAKTGIEAKVLRQSGTVIFSIGVGSGVKVSELNNMASDPDKEHVFTVTDFSAFGNIQKELATKACEAQKYTPIPPTQAPGCNVSMADILFILDSSGSVVNDDFARMITFVKEMVKGFDIGNNTIRVAVSLFAGGSKEEFHLNQYFDKNAMLKAIDNINRISGSTNTANALLRARIVNFQQPHGDRKGVPNIVIIITDGNSDNPIQTTNSAAQLKNTGAIVFSIGVGTNIHHSELESMATDNSHIFTVTNFKALENIKRNLAVKTCEAQVIPTKIPITCNQSMADIVFLLDSSGSVGASNFQKMLQFVENMVNGFDVGKDSVRIAIASFSDSPVQHFALNKYFNKSDIISAIAKLPYNQGSTNTAAAISLLRTGVFTASSGDRPTAPNIAIIITDGQSNDPMTTGVEAKSLRQSGTVIFSIGVGSGVKVSELNNMASDPDKEHVFTVTDFSAFGNIQNELATKACEAQKYTPLPPTQSPIVCNRTMADIVFALDTSASVDENSYKIMLTFVHQMVRSFDIGKDGVRVGLVTYSDNSFLEFHLNKYFNATALDNAISNVKYRAGSTNTADALRYIRTVSLLPQNGNRPNIPNIVIVLTDGKSNVPASTTAEAMKLKKIATVFSIGIGAKAFYPELKDIATDQATDHVFTVNNFQALNKIRSNLAIRTCEVGKKTDPEIRKCPAQADIVFILDSSGSVGAPNFQKMLSFVETVSKSFNIGPNEVQIGVDTFDSSSRTEFLMNKNKDLKSLLSSISSIPTSRNGITRMGEALRHLHNVSMSSGAGMRPNVSHIAIMLTDGRPNGQLNVIQESKRVKDAGVKLFTIGIGPNIDFNQLNNMASKPTTQFVFKADNFDSLKSIASMLSRQSCNACTSAADIVFVLDSSGSVGTQNFYSMLAFVNDIVDQMEIGPKHIQIGVLRYNSRNYLEFNLNKHTSKKSLQSAIQNIHYTPGNTATGSAISFMHYHMFTRASGFRKGVPKIAIVLTDGMSNIGLNTRVESDAAKKDNISMFAIGIGGAVNQAELKGIASDPNFVFSIKNFKNLPKIVDGLVKTTCKEIPTDSKPFECKDRINSCAAFGLKVCDGYQRWARYFCPKFCGACFDTPKCEDKAPTCAKLGSDNCIEFPAWSRENCARFCGHCGAGGNRTIGDRVHFCAYKGKKYATGETWNDGCQYQCSCLDALRGIFSCWSRCPVYYDIPPQCTMVSVPGKCCKEPVCNFDGKSTTTTGHGKGTWMGVDVCVYNGKRYYQDQTWSDGCQSDCSCKDAKSGLWVCQSKCPQYTQLPSICHLQQKSGECCGQVKCEFIIDFGKIKGGGKIVDKVDPVNPNKCVDKINCQNYGKAICMTPDLQDWVQKNCPLYCHNCRACLVGSKVYKVGETWQESCSMTCVCEDGLRGIARCYDKCSLFPNLPSNCQKVTTPGECCPKIKCDKGTIIDSGRSSNSSTGRAIQGCMYKGKYYTKDQTWMDGCDYSCKCIDAVNGIHECIDRCPTFENLPSDCKMVDVSGESCCQIPQCNSTRVVVPKFGKKHIGGGKVTTPVKEGCDYNGTLYQQGDKWRDGCKYYCECTDAKRGIYICKERCMNLGLIPRHCAAINDPHDDCCRQMVCTNLTDILVPQTTPSTIGMCYYKGQSYQKGQSWEDGCSLRCTCEDDVTGYYSCIDRCPGYSSVPASCTMKPHPKDKACCKIPDCQKSDTAIPLRSLKNGFGKALRPIPSQQNVCLFNHKTYKQGQSWDVGCEMQCECTDAKMQTFQCQSQCNEYFSIPKNCQEIPANHTCCSKLQCSSVPVCNDKSSTCQSAGPHICGGETKDFAMLYCRKTCGLCGGVEVTTSLPASCQDKDPNCATYEGVDVCSPVMRNYAIVQCRRFCKYCDQPIPK
ncbi:type VI, alpha, partial [Argonauta hians]